MMQILRGTEYGSVSRTCLCGEVSYDVWISLRWQEFVTARIASDRRGQRFQRYGASLERFSINGRNPKCYVDADTSSGSAVERHFCGDCGSPIYSIVPGSPDSLFLKTGTLDDTGDFEPQFHVWCDSKQRG